jgi:hypothetical protein
MMDTGVAITRPVPKNFLDPVGGGHPNTRVAITRPVPQNFLDPVGGGHPKYARTRTRTHEGLGLLATWF